MWSQFPLFCPFSDPLPPTALTLSESFSIIKIGPWKLCRQGESHLLALHWNIQAFPFLSLWMFSWPKTKVWNLGTSPTTYALWFLCKTFGIFHKVGSLEKLPRTCLKALHLAQRTPSLHANPWVWYGRTSRDRRQQAGPSPSCSPEPEEGQGSPWLTDSHPLHTSLLLTCHSGKWVPVMANVLPGP